MSKLSNLWLVLVFSILGACSTPPFMETPSVTPDIMMKERLTSTATKPTATTSSIDDTTPSKSVLETTPSRTPTEEGMVINCIAEESNLPSDISPKGTLVVRKVGEIALMDLKNKRQTEIPGTITSVGISPNGQWLSYNLLKDDQFKLMVQSADGKESMEIPRGVETNRLEKLHWIDNQRIWYPDTTKPLPALPIVILNPFTKEKIQLDTNYPGITSYLLGPGPFRFHFGYSSAVYDPSLNWVIYPEFDGKGKYFQTLWDRTNNRAVTRIEDDFGYGILTLWHESQKQFLVAGYPSADAMTKEWMAVSLNGQIRQITQLGKMEKNYRIQNNAVLSHDEKTLAFTVESVDNSTDSTTSSHLVLLDLDTGRLTDTCISADNIAWSLDNQYLAISAPKDENADYKIYLIDLKAKQSFPLTEGKAIFPVGWIEQP